MESSDCRLVLILIPVLICGYAEGYPYRNQRKFSEDIDWSYAGTLNQNHWAKKFPSCSNTKQSPIDIEENLTQVKLQYQNLKFEGWKNPTGDQTTIRNNGKTVAVHVDGDFYVSGGGLRSVFKVDQITFHWGRCNASSEGSEHSLEGVKFPLEMQIYCYEAHRFNSLDETIKSGGPITALAVLFETSSEDNVNYAAIIDAINNVSRYGKRAEVSPFTLQGLLPNSTEKYFIYNGSLTTPPCSETVEWIVFRNTVIISDEQLAMFCEVMTMQQASYVMLMDYLQNNYREQQQFMGQVFSSYTGTEELLTPVCSLEPENIQVTPYNLSSLLVTWERPRVVYDTNIEKYLVTYQLTTKDSEPSQYLTDGDQDVGAILDDLIANRSYVIQVVAVCTNRLYGRHSEPLTVIMADPENTFDPLSDEFEDEVNYESYPSWNEKDQTNNYKNSPRTMTPQSPFVFLPETGATKAESGRWRTATDPIPQLTSTKSRQTWSLSEGIDPRSSSMSQPENRGGADSSDITPFYPPTTTKAPFISTSATASYTTAETGGIHGGIHPKGQGITATMTSTTGLKRKRGKGEEILQEKSKGGAGTTTPVSAQAKTDGGQQAIGSHDMFEKEKGGISTTSSEATRAKMDGGQDRMTPNDFGKEKSGFSATTPADSRSETSSVHPGVIPEDPLVEVKDGVSRTRDTSPSTEDGERLFTTTTMLESAVRPSSPSSPSLIQAEIDQWLASPVSKDTTPDGTVSAAPGGLPEVHTPTAIGPSSSDLVLRRLTNHSSPHFPSTTTSVLLSSVLLQPIKPRSNATATTVSGSWMSSSDMSTVLHASVPPPSSTDYPSTPERHGLDSSSGSSGLASTPDSQEGVDQEWDRIQTSTSGENVLPYLNKETRTSNPSVPPESGQSPDDLDDHSSAFYFESGSGSTMTTKAEGKVSPTRSLVTSTPQWSLGMEEDSGSGQSEGLYENETSSDFSISEQTEREPEEEKPVAELSNSSHQSRVGSIRDLDGKAVVPLAIISTLTILGLVVLLGILVYWRLCFQTAHFYITDSSSPQVIAAPPTTALMSDGDSTFAVNDFVKNVKELHQSGGFHREFEEVEALTVAMAMTTDSSNHPDNKTKNRYGNVLAYDHSRVQLSPQVTKDGKTTDYINANFVDGYKKSRAYIAAQGPLKSSMRDFWRMVWEQKVGVIVMITNLVEKGRIKCDQYWPLEVQEDYGGLLVTLKRSDILAYYTKRTFSIRNTNIKKNSQKGMGLEQTVVQYHYTMWPDMGVPKFALPLLNFIRTSSRSQTDDMGPMVVHCSAGVGRTGTYIVLDSMLKQIRDEGLVSITRFLKQIRTQRNFLVQTEEQFVFIHDALVEAILSGDTEVSAAYLHRYVDELLTPLHDGSTSLYKQFKLLGHSEVEQADYSAALQDCNRNKNRNSALIPDERSRVHLSTAAGETSDYINASYIPGYRRSNEFIITQSPLPETVKDFWRMIWDQNSQTIVSLPGVEEVERSVFWPHKAQPVSCEMFTVTQRSETHICLSNEDMLVVQDYELQATQDDFVLEVKHFSAPRWPNPDGPISSTFELLHRVKEESNTSDGPTVVHDDVGGVTAGTFCALSSLIGQLNNEGSVNVFEVAKMISLMRPGTFSDIDQYQFLYRAVLSLIDMQEDEKTLQLSEVSGTVVVGTADTAESLESLV
ncbi:receptor-type tyrosine-protein phosphatase zeta isoform 2-T2 [Pholidichthys leucotaenia]